MVYEYYKLAQILATNDTTYKNSMSMTEQLQQECREIMKNDIAIVKVRLESNKYMRTVKDRRLTFADKLSAFGTHFTVVKSKNLIPYLKDVFFTGGTLGLCTGMSLLSMVEIAFWLMKIPSAFFKATTKKPQKKPKDGINKSVYF